MIETIRSPDAIFQEDEKTIAHTNITDRLVLRVVYREFESFILIITLYPEKRSRYEKIHYSKDVDALLIELLDLPIAYAEDDGKIILHYSEDDRLVLIEILDLAQFMATDDGGFKELMYS